METYEPRIWHEYKSLSLYAKSAAKLEGKIIEVVLVDGGWIIPNHYADGNIFFREVSDAESQYLDEQRSHFLDCEIAAHAQTEEENDTLMEGWLSNTGYD
jgi:hypothetical protein